MGCTTSRVPVEGHNTTSTSSTALFERHNVNSAVIMGIRNKIPDLFIEKALGQGNCSHKFLNKYEGLYFCTDCTYELKEPVDTARIQSEREQEANTPTDTIPPGLTVGKMSQMRGVSIAFLLAFTSKFNCWDKSSWWIIRNIIKPMTETRRCRFVELYWMAEHVGPAKTFISYAQQGSWGDLVAGILDGGADLERTVWLDIFAVRQWPSDTPDLDFASTIEHCDSFLCVCSYVESVDKMQTFDAIARKTELIPLVDRKKIAFLRVWCLVEIAAAAKKADMHRVMKCGSHKVHSNGNVEFKSKSNVLRNLFHLIDINKAEATVESDRSRILSDIQGTLTMEGLNRVVRGVLTGGFGISEFSDIGSIVQCAACDDPKSLDYIKRNVFSSIHAVAAGGFTKLFPLLLQGDIDVNVKDKKHGSTSLMFASQGGHVSCIEMLIARGVDVNARANDGTTALMYASQGGHVSCIEILIARGADLNAKDNVGTTALMYASQGGHVSCIEMLIARGADLNAKDNNGWTAFIAASAGGHVSCIEMLIARGADLNAKDNNNGWTALMYASAGGHVSCIEMLIARGADLNAKVNDGTTALMAASAGGHVSCIEMLIARGADLNAKDNNNGMTAFMYASAGGHSAVKDILKSRGAIS